MKITLTSIFRSLFLLSLCAALAAGQNATIWFTALEKNDSFCPVLTAPDVEVRDGKTAFRIERLTPKMDMPLEVLILFDASGSQKDLMTGEKDVAAHFIENILRKDTDKVAVVRFSSATTLVCDLTADLDNARASLAGIAVDPPDKLFKGAPYPQPAVTTTGSALLEKINAFPIEYRTKRAERTSVTSVWGSTRWAIEKFAELKPTGARRVVILITDGLDTKGDQGFKEAIESSLGNQIPVFPIAMSDGVLGMITQTWLVEFAYRTGGTALLPQKRKRTGFAVDMRQIEQRLRNYYEVIVSADPSGEKDKIRKIDIRIINDALRKTKVRTLYPRGFILN